MQVPFLPILGRGMERQINKLLMKQQQNNTSTTTNTPARLMAARKEANTLGVWLSKRPTKTPANNTIKLTDLRNTNHTPELKMTLPPEHVFFIERLTNLMKEHPNWRKQNKYQKRFSVCDFCVMDILMLLNPDKKPGEFFKATN